MTVDDAVHQELLDELRRSRSQLAEAQSIARLGSWEIRTDPRVVTWTEGMYDVLGVEPAAVVASSEEFASRVFEVDRRALTETWAQLVVISGEHAIDIRIVRGDGSLRWVRAAGRVLARDADGQPTRYGGTVQDIHTLKETELQLLDALELNTLMQLLATAANETNTFDEALGRTRELLLAHPDWERGVAFDRPAGGLEFRVVAGSDDGPTVAEQSLAARVLAEGRVVFGEDDRPLIGFPVPGDDGPMAIIVITARSPFERHAMMVNLVTQVAGQLAQVAAREKTATELATARDLAMAASHTKSEFLATMSHEIRTPLNGVIGLNDLLLRTDLDDRQREFAEAMRGAGQALLLLINDILDFSKIEAGGLELEAVTFQPAVVLAGTRELFTPVAAARGVDLEVEVDASVPVQLEGDPSRWAQVLSNLVSNAIKFTHEGSVRIRVGAIRNRTEVTLRVEVQDTGIGMDPGQLNRIFQPFRQADASTTRTFGGTGLGLAIAHRLAGALGGEIGVDSVPGEGSTFWFTGRFRSVEAKPVPARGAESQQIAQRQGGHVLVVEDNEVNQLVAAGMLEALGCSFEVVGDGAAAAARATNGQFDAVLMDLQMPRLDGFASTRLIRQSEPPGVNVPIIALTASATPGEEQRCLDAGMNGFLSKPVSLEALATALGAHVPAITPAESAAGPRPDPRAGAFSAPPLTAPGLDTSRLGDLVEMGPEAVPLIRRAIDNFIAGSEAQTETLRTLWKQRDEPGLRAAAHRLKGSAANLGALRVAALAFDVECLAESEDFASIGPVLVDLSAALDEVVGELAEFELVVPGADDDLRYA